MGKRPPKSGGLRFAEAVTVAVAEEALRCGRRRVCNPQKFVGWAEQVLRTAHGNIDRVIEQVAHKIGWLVYGVSIDKEGRERCRKKAEVLVSRRLWIRNLLAEQVLTQLDEPTDPGSLLLAAATAAVGTIPSGIGKAAARAIREMRACRRKKRKRTRSRSR